MTYPTAIIEKAKRTERLLLRVSSGEPLQTVGDQLNMTVSEARFAKLVKKYDAGGQTYEAVIDGRCGHPQKAHAGIREWLYAQKRAHPQHNASQLACAIESEFDVKLSKGHINYLLRRVGLSGARGRPKSVPPGKPSETDSTDPDDEELSNAGLFFPRSRDATDGGTSRCRAMHR